jgi:uncharacterized protein (UPF0264 family)
LRLGELCRVDADIVGVRSCVCREGDRSGELDTDLVAAAVAELTEFGAATTYVLPASPKFVR